ncbi:MAG: glycosyltransferase family A protein [Spirochaetia bacterium]
MPKVSIIISNYNYGRYLQQSLESALQQDMPEQDIEIILIDDCSTDTKTRIFLEKYQHPRIKKILLQENVGVVRARNIAIEQATGQYIIPLDADDFFEKDYVRLAAQVLDEQQEVGIVYALGMFTGDATGQWLQPFDLERVLLEGGTPSGSMFRKKDFQAVGGYHDYMKNGWEDWDFWLCFIERGFKVHTLTQTVGFYYRIKADSRSNDQASKHIDMLWENLYLHHKDLYHAHPAVLSKVLAQAYHYRRISESFSYRLGKKIIAIARFILFPWIVLKNIWKRIRNG